MFLLYGEDRQKLRQQKIRNLEQIERYPECRSLSLPSEQGFLSAATASPQETGGSQVQGRCLPHQRGPQDKNTPCPMGSAVCLQQAPGWHGRDVTSALMSEQQFLGGRPLCPPIRAGPCGQDLCLFHQTGCFLKGAPDSFSHTFLCCVEEGRAESQLPRGVLGPP